MNNLLEKNINKKLTSGKMIVNNDIDVDIYDEDLKEYIIKIDSKDRNIKQYPNPFKFKVRFNDNETFGQAPVIQARYQNVKSIELLETIIPRYNYSQIYNNTNYDIFNNGIISSLSLIETKKKLKISLNKGDIVTINNTDLKILDFVSFSDFDRFSVNIYPEFNFSDDITYTKVRLSGKIYSDGNSNFISGINTTFNELEKDDIILIKNKEYVIDSILSNYKIKLTDKIYNKIEDAEIFLVNKKYNIKLKPFKIVKTKLI